MIHGKPQEEVPYEGGITVPTHYLEAVDLDLGDTDDEIDFAEVAGDVFDAISDSDGDVEETLEQVIRSMNETTFLGNTENASASGGLTSALQPSDKHKESLTKRPEVIDDYIRNYLSSKGLFKSLDAFQNEWYELHQKGLLTPEDISIVPDVYLKNQELSDSLAKLRVDVDTYKQIASKARATYDKLRKERDFHRMHHKRVVQEKQRLAGDVRRLKKHYESYEPTLKELRGRYEVAMKEKMLVKLERDRVVGKLNGLVEATPGAAALVMQQQSNKPKDKNQTTARRDAPDPKSGAKNAGVASSAAEKGKSTPTTAQTPLLPKKSGGKDGPAAAVLPLEDRANPNAGVDHSPARVDRMRQIHSIKAHNAAVSAIKFHPKKLIIATASDDKTWKLWTFPSGDLVMSGEGHRDWIADLDFHPKGTQLATASGDGTLKLWDFARGNAILTLSDHTQAAWSCCFHDTGDFLATCSMDHTAKLWDLNVGKCRQTFRGHADSVNCVGWVPYTNTLYTCSGDKTVSLWDARTGLCSQTLYGHVNAINHVAFSVKGDTVASCDSDGVVKFWDIRNVSELDSVDFGPHAANKLAFDPSGQVLSVASNDGFVKIYNVRERTTGKEIGLGDDAIQALAFDRTGEYLVTAGSDSVVRVYQ